MDYFKGLFCPLSSKKYQVLNFISFQRAYEKMFVEYDEFNDLLLMRGALRVNSQNMLLKSLSNDVYCNKN